MSRLFRFPAPALWPGLALAAALAAFAIFLSRLPFSTQAGLSALTYAIVTGLVIGNSVYPRLAVTPHPACCLPRATCCASAWHCTAFA